MVDRFGGSYVHIHFDISSGVLTNWFGMPKAVVIGNIHDVDITQKLSALVSHEKQEELKARDMSEISNLINSQYY